MKMEMSVVPAPMSASATPRSLSSSVSTALADALGLSTSCSTSRSAAAHALDDVLGRALGAGHDVRTFTSRRPPLTPIGSLTSWPSMMNSCGSTSSGAGRSGC